MGRDRTDRVRDPTLTFEDFGMSPPPVPFRDRVFRDEHATGQVPGVTSSREVPQQLRLTSTERRGSAEDLEPVHG